MTKPVAYPDGANRMLNRMTNYKMFNMTEFHHSTWNVIFITAAAILISYVTIVRRLRYHRRAKIEAPFGPGKRKLSSMTVKEAHSIITELQELEFPYAFSKARKIALLKVRKRKINANLGLANLVFATTGRRHPNYV